MDVDLSFTHLLRLNVDFSMGPIKQNRIHAAEERGLRYIYRNL